MATTTSPGANHDAQEPTSKPSTPSRQVLESQHSIYARRALLRLADTRRSALRQARIDRVLHRFDKEQADELYSKAKIIAEFKRKEEEMAKDDMRRLEEYQKRLAEEEEKKTAPAGTSWDNLSDDAQWGPSDMATSWTSDSSSESDSETEDEGWGTGASSSWSDQTAEPKEHVEEQEEPQTNDGAATLDLSVSPDAHNAHKADKPTEEDEMIFDNNDDESQTSIDRQHIWDWDNHNAWDVDFGLDPNGNETSATSRCHSAGECHNNHSDESDDDDFLLCTNSLPCLTAAVATPTGSLPLMAATSSRIGRTYAKPTEKDAERVALLLQDRQWRQLRRKIKANTAESHFRREGRRTMPCAIVREAKTLASKTDPRKTIYNVVNPEIAGFHRGSRQILQREVSPLWQCEPQRTRWDPLYRLRRIIGRTAL